MDGTDFDKLLLQEQERVDDDKVQSNISDNISGWRKSLECPELDPASDGAAVALSSPIVETRTICGDRTVHIHRDDLLKLPQSGISGNKARKLWALDQVPAESFPTCVVSYGGPQSNAMLALAAIVYSKNRQLLTETTEAGMADAATTLDTETLTQQQELPTHPKKVRFIYYTKTLPRFLRNQRSGNLFRATTLGMELRELSHADYASLFDEHCDYEGRPPLGLDPPADDALWIPQGGAFALAQPGVQRLAKEIVQYWKGNGKERPLIVCVPSGTCTTATLLHHGIQDIILNGSNDDNDEVMDIQVVAIPCVGDTSYARQQMMSLSAQINKDPNDIPTILTAGPSHSNSKDASNNSKYFTFGKPDQEILTTFQELRNDHNLVVDLMYGAPSWAILLRHIKAEQQQHTAAKEPFVVSDVSFDPNQPLLGRELLYVHSGGREGINSQLLRYKYEGLVSLDEIQLPGKSTIKTNSRASS